MLDSVQLRTQVKSRMAYPAFIASLFLACILSHSAKSAPSNDNLANATSLGSPATFTVSGDTTGASTENGEPGIGGNGQTIWYKWIAPATQAVQLNTLNSAVNRTFRVGVFTSTTPNAPVFPLTSVVQGLNAVQFAATANTVYFLCVDTSKNGQPGGVNLNLSAAPANDNLANAVDLGNGATFAVSGDNTGATKEAGETGTFTVWYKWTAPTASTVRVNTNGSKTNHTLRIFTSPSPATIASLVTVQTSTVGSATSFSTTAATVYYIQVDSNANLIGPFLLSLPANPTNDFFAGITDLQTQASFSVLADNTGATLESTEPPDFAGAGGTLWYKWTSPAARRVQIDTFGSVTTPTRVDLFTGTQLNSLTSVSSNGNLVQFNAAANTPYLIRLDSVGALGQMKLNLAAQTNDQFANAIALSGTNLTGIAGDTTNASKEANEPNHGGDPGGASVWYSWTAPITGPVTINQTSIATSGVNLVNHSVAVYTGTTVNGLTLVNPNSQAAPALNNQVTFNATSGTVYRIAVDGQGGAFGAFTLNLSIFPPPANDNFASSQPLTGSPVTVLGTNQGATLEATEPSSVGSGSTVWYNWSAPSTGTYVVTTGNFNGIIDVFTGSALTALTKVATGQQVLTFTASAGTVYQIRIDSFGQNVFNLSILPTPPNDNFANSTVLTGATFDVSGYNFGATLEAGEPVITGPLTVWWSWTAPVSASVAVTIDGSGGNIDGLRVYTGSAVNALTPVSVNQTSSTFATSIFAAVQGTTYRFQVFSSAGDNIELALKNPPSNDNFASSIALSGTLAQITGNNYAATAESGEPAHNGSPSTQSVWYNWTAPSSGKTTISLNNLGFTSVLAVYTGTAVNALTQVTSGTTTCTFTATAGTVYQIAVDGSSQGTFGLSLREVPPNDDFANAILLTGYTSTTGSNNLATKEAGEPAHGGNAGGKSVWWTWVAPDTRLVEITTTGSAFDTLLGVYTGAAVSSLTQVAGNDNEAPGIQTSKVQFNSVAGTTYFIAVDGSGGATGSINLIIRRADVAITSPLTVSPVPQVAGKPLTFTVVTDAPATFTWSYGDGLVETSTSGTIVHTYATPGTYMVTVTASEDNGFSVSSSLTITVLASKDLGVGKLGVSLDFTKKANDVLSGSGFLTLPAAGSLSGPLMIKFDGIVTNLNLTNGASPKSKTIAFRLQAPKGIGTAKYSFKLVGDYQAALAPLGFTKTASHTPIDVPVQIVLDGVSYEFKFTVIYTSTGKKGTAK